MTGPGDKLPGEPKPCPGCGEEPQRGKSAIGKTFRHCDSPTCPGWARCPTCKTTWDIDTGVSFHE